MTKEDKKVHIDFFENTFSGKNIFFNILPNVNPSAQVFILT